MWPRGELGTTGLLVVMPCSLQLCTSPHPYPRVHTCIPFWMKPQAGCPDFLYVRVSQGHMILMNRVLFFPVHLVSLSILLSLGSSLPCPCLPSVSLYPACLVTACFLPTSCCFPFVLSAHPSLPTYLTVTSSSFSSAFMRASMSISGLEDRISATNWGFIMASTYKRKGKDLCTWRQGICKPKGPLSCPVLLPSRDDNQHLHTHTRERDREGETEAHRETDRQT